MRSWVRYSVSAYMGLLLAGSVASPGVAPPSGEPMASIYERSAPPSPSTERYYLVPAARPEPGATRAES